MDHSARVGTSLVLPESALTRWVSVSKELAALHKTMAKLLKQKETLQRGLGNEYGVWVASFHYDRLAETFQASLP